MKARTSVLAPHLVWSHFGRLYRATVFPELRFQRETETGWEAFTPDPGAGEIAAAAVMLKPQRWTIFLEYAPPAWREFIESFKTRRLEVWCVLAHCPELLTDMTEAPALALFVADHVELRGANGPRWTEISAVYERSGYHGVLEWLGLPATKVGRQALAELPSGEFPKRDLFCLRERLWNVSQPVRRTWANAMAA